MKTLNTDGVTRILPPNELIHSDNSNSDGNNSLNSDVSDDGKMYAAVLSECQNQSHVTIQLDELVSVKDEVNKALHILVDKCKLAGISTQVLIFFNTKNL